MAQPPSPTVLAGSAEPAGRRVGAGDVIYLSALSAMAILGANIVLPGFPALQAAFGLADAEVRMVLTAYLLAWAAGQVLLGAALDRHSPQRVLLLGLAAALVGSLLCLLARDHNMLLVGRVLQGAGFAAGSVIWRLFARQGRGPEALAHVIARVGALTPVVSMLTPVLGSQLVIAAGPRLVFAVTALLAAGLMLWTLPQGKGEVRRGGPGYWAGYAQVLRDPVARLTLTALVLNSAYTYAFLSIAPHLMMREFGLGEAAYGYAMAVVPVAMMLSGLLNDRLARQWDERRFLQAGGLGVALAASALSGLVAAGAAGPLSVIALIVLGVPFGAMVNLAGMMGMMRRFDHGGGAASSAIGLSMLGGAFVGSTVMIGVNSAGAGWSLPLLAIGLTLGLGTTALVRRDRDKPTAPAAPDPLAQRRHP